jgi:hypothetical protein
LLLWRKRNEQEQPPSLSTLTNSLTIYLYSLYLSSLSQESTFKSTSLSCSCYSRIRNRLQFRLSLILFRIHILCGTNLSWLAGSPTPTFTYFLTACGHNFFTLPVIGVISTTSRESLMLCLRIIKALEHSRIGL